MTQDLAHILGLPESIDDTSLPSVALPETEARIGSLEKELSALRAFKAINNSYFLALDRFVSSLASIAQSSSPSLQEEIAAFSGLCAQAFKMRSFPSSREEAEATAARLLNAIKRSPLDRRVASFMEALQSADTPLEYLMAALGHAYLAHTVVEPGIADASPEALAGMIFPPGERLISDESIRDTLSIAEAICSDPMGNTPLLVRAGLDDGSARRARQREVGQERSAEYQAIVEAAKDEIVLPNPFVLPPALPMKSAKFIRALSKVKDESVDSEWLGKVAAASGLTEAAVTSNIKRLGLLLVEDNFPEAKEKKFPLLVYYQMFMLVFREFVKGGLRFSSIARDLEKREEFRHD